MIFFKKLFKSFVKLSSQGYQVSEKRKNRNERKKKATLIIWVGHKRWPVTFTPVKLLIKMEICFLCWQECDPWLWLISSFSSFEKKKQLFFCGAEHGFSVGSGSGFFFIYLYFCGKSNVLFQLLFNAAFAHRAAVDNKHPSVFMLSLSCKNLPRSLSLLKTYSQGYFVLLGWRYTFILDS